MTWTSLIPSVRFKSSSTSSILPCASSGTKTWAMSATRPKATGSSSYLYIEAFPSNVFRIFSFRTDMSACGSEGNILIETSTYVIVIYGPVNPHFGHLYGRPNPRHFSQRQIVTSPHWGHGKWTAPSRGSIMRPHQLH